MYTGLASLIVKELQSKGFNAQQLGAGLTVSLKRPISTMEVEQALTEVFGEIHFKLTRLSPNKVMVQE